MFPTTQDPFPLNSSVVTFSESANRKQMHVKIGSAEFEKIQEARKKTGTLGERFILRYEKHRLRKEGLHNLVDKIEQISKTDIGAGYDILSFNSDGSRRYIEVKTRVGRGLTFEWSTNEMNVAKQHNFGSQISI